MALEDCKITEYKHKQVSDVGGELNLIRASKKPGLAPFRRNVVNHHKLWPPEYLTILQLQILSYTQRYSSA